ncbi:MAG: class I SAM-dependent methyltransferase [Gammaproteobacteria bacterium]|nr:class I SAM-dependent methyltransferase [Gammaproteobacteria bacterium]
MNAERDAAAEPKAAVDFGFQQVSPEEKTRRVRDVFASVATRYDLMNDLMSLGVHRLWKRLAVGALHARPGERILDVAGGTGDLTRLLARRVGPSGCVTLSDINGSMLAVGRDRLLDAGIAGNVAIVQGNAEALPFADQSFDAGIIAFGLRNVTDKEAALRSCCRVLRPGGRFIVLEFSRVVLPLLARLYDRYSFSMLPRLGAWVAGDAPSYQYLAESIRRHPDQETLLGMMRAAGFDRCDYFNFSGGIVALHRGYRP